MKTASPAPYGHLKARLDEVERRYLAGHPEHEIAKECAVLFQRSRRQVWKYIATVRATLKERAKALDPDAERARIQGMLLRTFRSAEQGTDKGPNHNAMVAAAARLAELQGLVTQRIDHSVQAAAHVVVMPPLDSLDAPVHSSANALAAQSGPTNEVPKLSGG